MQGVLGRRLLGSFLVRTGPHAEDVALDLDFDCLAGLVGIECQRAATLVVVVVAGVPASRRRIVGGDIVYGNRVAARCGQ